MLEHVFAGATAMLLGASDKEEEEEEKEEEEDADNEDDENDEDDEDAEEGSCWQLPPNAPMSVPS
jgi:hypothetical protein